MSRNIIIFSDGTGQAGGITFDEVRTNVYKLYRACRVGPDTTIDPTEQVTFYDPGLGSPADGSKIKIHWARAIYNLASKATGLGITSNIIDCYAALIRLYRDGGFRPTKKGHRESSCAHSLVAECSRSTKDIIKMTFMGGVF
jgi:uncharacterized protein (DUF2235 family)